MKAILITYDLNRPGQDYTAVHDAIKALGDWCHPLESTWVVATRLSASEVWDRISRAFDKSDLCLTIDVTGDTYSGWLPENVWDWLRDHVRTGAWR